MTATGNKSDGKVPKNETTLPLYRAMDSFWNKNMVTRLSTSPNLLFVLLFQILVSAFTASFGRSFVRLLVTISLLISGLSVANTHLQYTPLVSYTSVLFVELSNKRLMCSPWCHASMADFYHSCQKIVCKFLCKMQNLWLKTTVLGKFGSTVLNQEHP